MAYIGRYIREQKGISQSELVSRSGLPYEFINNLESGKAQDTSTRDLGKIAEVLDCRVTDLIL